MLSYQFKMYTLDFVRRYTNLLFTGETNVSTIASKGKDGTFMLLNERIGSLDCKE